MSWKIDFLHHHPHLIDEIALYFYDEWSHMNPDKSVQDVARALQGRVNEDKVPLALVALDDQDRFAGTISLKEHDLENHPDYSPWLASLFVLPEYRGQGLGKVLVQYLMDIARGLDIPRLYLHTETARDYYQRLGWRLLASEELNGVQIHIMEFIL